MAKSQTDMLREKVCDAIKQMNEQELKKLSAYIAQLDAQKLKREANP